MREECLPLVKVKDATNEWNMMEQQQQVYFILGEMTTYEVQCIAKPPISYPEEDGDQ